MASAKRQPSVQRIQAPPVVSKAGIRAAAILGLNQATLARVLGVSPSTVTRLHAGDYVLPADSKPYELALLLIRLFRGLDALMGGEETVIRSWMQAPNTALGNAPLALITSVTGLVDTVAYVDSARARV
jgi:DNA-binding XRE family transcriptional regulator